MQAHGKPTCIVTQDLQGFYHHLYDIIVKIMVEVLNILQRYRSGELSDQH